MQCAGLSGSARDLDSEVRIIQSVYEVITSHCFASSVLEIGKSESGEPSDVRMKASERLI